MIPNWINVVCFFVVIAGIDIIEVEVPPVCPFPLCTNSSNVSIYKRTRVVYFKINGIKFVFGFSSTKL